MTAQPVMHYGTATVSTGSSHVKRLEDDAAHMGMWPYTDHVRNDNINERTSQRNAGKLYCKVVWTAICRKVIL